MCLGMPRELRLDFGGRSYRWFDVDEMVKVHGTGLTETLREEIKQHFNVPAEFQVLCDAEGPLASPADLRRLLMGVAPQLHLFDSRQMGEGARERCRRSVEGWSAELEASRTRLSELGFAHAEVPPPPPASPAEMPSSRAPGAGAEQTMPWAQALQLTAAELGPATKTPTAVQSARGGSVPLASALKQQAGAASPSTSLAGWLLSDARSAAKVSSQVPMSARSAGGGVATARGASASSLRPRPSTATPQAPASAAAEPAPAPAPLPPLFTAEDLGTGSSAQERQLRSPARLIPGAQPLPSSRAGTPRRPAAPSWLPPSCGGGGASASRGASPRAAGTRMVQVLLSKSSPSQVFGFTNVPEVMPDGRECLRITEVSPEGLLAEWNLLCPQQRLAAGDRVLAVNGVQGDILQMRHLLCGSSIRLVGERCPGPPSPGLGGETPAASSRSRPPPWPEDPRAEGIRRRVRQAKERLGSSGSLTARSSKSQREASKSRHRMLREELQDRDTHIQDLEQQLLVWQRLAEPLGGPVSTPRSAGLGAPATSPRLELGGLAANLGLAAPATSTPSAGRRTPRAGGGQAVSWDVEAAGDGDEELKALQQGMWQMAALVADKDSEIEELRKRVESARQRSEASALHDLEDRASHQRLSALEAQLRLLAEQVKPKPPEATTPLPPPEPLPPAPVEQGVATTPRGGPWVAMPAQERLLQCVSEQAEEVASWGQKMKAMETRMDCLAEERLQKERTQGQPVPVLPLQAGVAAGRAWEAEQGDTDGDAATIRMGDCWRGPSGSAAACPPGLRPGDAAAAAVAAAAVGPTASPGVPWAGGAGPGREVPEARGRSSQAPPPRGLSEEELPSPRSELSAPSPRRRPSLPRRASPRRASPPPAPAPEAERAELRELQRSLATAARRRDEEACLWKQRDELLAEQLASQNEEIHKLQGWRQQAQLEAAQAREREQAVHAVEAQRRCELLEREVPAEMRMMQEWHEYQQQVAQAEAAHRCEIQELRQQERRARELARQQQLELAAEMAEQELRLQAQRRCQRDRAHLAQLVRDAEALGEQEMEIQEQLFAAALQRQRPGDMQAWQTREREMEEKVEQHKLQRQEMAARVERHEQEQQEQAARMKEQEHQRRELAAQVEQQESQWQEMAAVLQRQERHVQELQASQRGGEQAAAAGVERAAEVEELAELRRSREGEREMAALAAERMAEVQELQRRAQAGPRSSLVQRSEVLAAQATSEAEAWRQSEMQVSSQVRMQDAEIEKMRRQDVERQRHIANLESQLEELARRPAPAPTPPPEPPAAEPLVEPPEEPAPVQRWYVAKGDDELDQLLEAQLLELGPDPLKGNELVRTGPSKYKLGDQRVFMKLNAGAVTVRDSGKFVSLAQWCRDLEPAAGPRGSLADDDLFGAMDATSPYAQHG